MRDGTPIPALLPTGPGHQLSFYADSCSGVPGVLHEQTHARVNSVVSRIRPETEFINFPGDEIIGLIHEGVLQIISAGAVTAQRMPEESKYLH